MRDFREASVRAKRAGASQQGHYGDDAGSTIAEDVNRGSEPAADGPAAHGNATPAAAERGAPRNGAVSAGGAPCASLQLDAAHLVLLLDAMALESHFPAKTWLDGFWACGTARLEETSPQQAIRLLRACGQLASHDSNRWCVKVGIVSQ